MHAQQNTALECRLARLVTSGLQSFAQCLRSPRGVLRGAAEVLRLGQQMEHDVVLGLEGAFLLHAGHVPAVQLEGFLLTW